MKSRRDALKSLTIGATASAVAGSSVAASELRPTPKQTAGPFYPDINNDLTYVKSREDRSKGEYIYIHGVVRDTLGKPVQGALVEIWQTDHQGIYDHAGDENQADKDPNFQSFGRCVTDEDGNYSFKTIRPRYYSAGAGYRTPHVHYKVWRRGYHELITQMYFEGEGRNAEDGIYKSLSSEDQDLVTIDFKPVDQIPGELAESFKKEFKEDSLDGNSKVGKFDLAMRIA